MPLTSPPPFCRAPSLCLALVAVLAAATARAQEPATSARQFPPPIEDNSFLVEEAYNQEKRVVQHVSNLVHLGAASYDYSFTQEWPIRGQVHQISYTVPYSWPRSGRGGMGDVFLNYRYQLFGHESWAAVSPRVSLVIPGRAQAERRAGLQVNVPASRRMNARLVVHANAGATLLPAESGHAWNLGGSAVGLVSRNFNAMLELVSTWTVAADGAGGTTRSRETILSPGVRCAINRGSLQVVPGLGLPLRLSGGRVRPGLFAYLSFEHPF